MKGHTKRRLTGALAAMLLIVSMLLPAMAAPAAAAKREPEKIHPELVKKAERNPRGTVRVIVQGSDASGDLGTEIDRLGGRDKKDLSIIKGYSAEMPASAVRSLAKNPKTKWLTVDAQMTSTDYVDTERLATVYPKAVNADEAWNGDNHYTGAGVGVLVVDSGLATGLVDFSGSAGNRILKNIGMSSDGVIADSVDLYGHGTHVAGIIAGNGSGSNGKYIGIAPQAKLISMKVSDGRGMAYMSQVINSLQWAVLNRAAYNIRVLNLSLVSSVAESYLTSPLDAAVEMAWLSGIVVVVSAGNLGANTALYPPANDPFVITVGAADDNATKDRSDDLIPSWSSYGATQDGFSKPEVVAPGRRIVSNLASSSSVLAQQYPDRIVDTNYLRLSGTSMSAPVVSGIAALALQAHPGWTPDQFKSALMITARRMYVAGSGYGEVDAYRVVNTYTPGYANRGIALNSGVAASAGAAVYDAATWNSATWNSATWNSATWNSATWNSATWNSATWNSATWNSATWNSAYPD